MRNLGERPFSVAFGEEQEGQASTLGSLAVNLTVPHVERAALPECSSRRAQRSRIGLLHREGVAADDGREVRCYPQFLQDPSRDGTGLVGAEGQLVSLESQLPKAFRYEGIKLGSGCRRGFVMVHEATQKVLVSLRINSTEAVLHDTLNQPGRAVTDERSYGGKLQRRLSFFFQSSGYSNLQIGYTIDQGSIEVEDDVKHPTLSVQ